MYSSIQIQLIINHTSLLKLWISDVMGFATYVGLSSPAIITTTGTKSGCTSDLTGFSSVGGGVLRRRYEKIRMIRATRINPNINAKPPNNQGIGEFQPELVGKLFAACCFISFSILFLFNSTVKMGLLFIRSTTFLKSPFFSFLFLSKYNVQTRQWCFN